MPQTASTRRKRVPRPTLDLERERPARIAVLCLSASRACFSRLRFVMPQLSPERANLRIGHRYDLTMAAAMDVRPSS